MRLTVVLLLLLSVTTLQAENNPVEKELKMFVDPVASGLKRGVSVKKIKRMQVPELKALAEAMHAKNYRTDYRLAKYSAVLDPTILGRQLHIGSGYSNYENITGVMLAAGRNLVLVQGLPDGKELDLLIPNWTRRPPENISPTKDPQGWGLKRDAYKLHNGVNFIEVKKEGLAYLPYFSEQPQKEKPVTVHFVHAAINGYFDVNKHNDDDWNRLLDNAVYPILDARGRHIQVAYPVEAFNKYARGRGVELIRNYDTLVYRQHRIMGLIKYNRVPQNRILARVNYNYYMFRDGDGVAYMGGKQGYAMKKVTDPEEVIGRSTWGFCHEVGHVHQLRPYMNWTGLGEVSNNIFANYVSTSVGNKSAVAAKYAPARANYIDKQRSFMEPGDLFEKLVPFWQLHLYFTRNGNSDFYADLQEYFRSLPEVTKANRKTLVEYQLDFVRQSCRIGKTDLTDFFEKWGFFKVGEWEQPDYSKGTYRLTQEMADAVKAEIKAMNLPQPTMDVTMVED